MNNNILVASTSENLKKAIDRHLNLLNKAIYLTQAIFDSAQKENHQELTRELENRNRLVIIIGHVQEKIERSLKVIPQEVYSKEIESNIEQWQSELNKAVQCITEMDQKILECLDCSKNKIKQELSVTYKNKVAHKKYDLSTLKR